MWARTTLRHTLRQTLPLAQGKLHVSSTLALSFALPVTINLASRAFSSTPAVGSPRLAECTRWLIHDASSAASRECPTPLVLLRTPRLTYGETDPAHEESYRAWADTFAARGYTAVEVDVSVDPNAGASETAANGESNGTDHASFPEPINSAKAELNAQLRLLNIPFAPIVIASGPAGLVAQAYVSDHRASGLVLVDPPSDTDPRKDKNGWTWPQFNYEPRFPILLMPAENPEAVKSSRVGKAAEEGVGRGGQGVQIQAVVDGVRGDGTRLVSLRPLWEKLTRQEIERWMDRCGF